jgi:Resolvase, N terminal domain
MEWAPLFWPEQQAGAADVRGRAMKATSVKLVRCAIYTRVSIDQGLDQEFNSLDAQYDASSAYIKSQAHAGWTLIKARYDDGGYSGGSTDRPTEFIDRIDVHKDHLAVRLKPRDNSGATNLNDGNDPTDDRLLSMPWQTPPSKTFRQILLPHGSSRNDQAGAAGTAPPTGQRHRARQALARRDDLKLRGQR